MDCLNLLSDLIRFLLTLFVHEKQIDYSLLRAMLESSSNLQYVSPHTKRKTLLTHFIMDHGLWSDILSWKECIFINISEKMEESSQRIKKRQELKAKSESTSKFMPSKKIFGKGIAKMKNMM